MSYGASFVTTGGSVSEELSTHHKTYGLPPQPFRVKGRERPRIIVYHGVFGDGAPMYETRRVRRRPRLEWKASGLLANDRFGEATTRVFYEPRASKIDTCGENRYGTHARIPQSVAAALSLPLREFVMAEADGGVEPIVVHVDGLLYKEGDFYHPAQFYALHVGEIREPLDNELQAAQAQLRAGRLSAGYYEQLRSARSDDEAAARRQLAEYIMTRW